MRNRNLRRSGFKIMLKLISLLGNLTFIMILAVINGTFGFLLSMGVTVLGTLGIVKFLGEPISLGYGVIIGLTICCGVLRGILRYFEQYTNHYIAFRLLAVIRDKIFGALRRLCPAKLESKEKGSIIAMITSDIETLEVFYAHTISPICIAILVSLSVCVFVGFIASPWLSLVALIGYIFIGVIVPIFSSRKLKESGVRYRKEFSDFSSYFLDSIKGVQEIVLSGTLEKRKEEIENRSENLIIETKKMKKDSTAAAAFTEITVSFFILLTLIVGIILGYSGCISVGRLLLGVVTVFSSFGPVIAISALPGNLTQTFASGDRVLNLLSERPIVEPIRNGKNFRFQRLDVKNLSFSYDGGEEVLHNINLHVEKGEIVGIVGASGCGKSTFLKLLLHFFKKSHGSIFYNGIDIDEINDENLLQNVTMVSQSTYLFHATIEENLKIAKQDATKEEMIKACQMASIHEFIEGLPEGYKTDVGDLGEKISAGEKQRIGLARAFLSGSELILLDEPTSNVDSMNEGIILKALKEQRKHKSIILVSHRESTMSIADRIYGINGGKIYEV